MVWRSIESWNWQSPWNVDFYIHIFHGNNSPLFSPLSHKYTQILNKIIYIIIRCTPDRLQLCFFGANSRSDPSCQRTVLRNWARTRREGTKSSKVVRNSTIWVRGWAMENFIIWIPVASVTLESLNHVLWRTLNNWTQSC